MKKIIAIVGTYRKNHIIDSAVDEFLKQSQLLGWQVEKIYLMDKKIEFCLNCRKCVQRKIDASRDECVHNDDMAGVLDSIDSSDVVVLASPVNYFTVTAVMKKFVERLIVYGYWPWGKGIPKYRVTKKTKKAVLITASACPAFIGRFAFSSTFKIMKAAADSFGAKVVAKIYIGGVAINENETLAEKYRLKLRKAAESL
jgi:multimeric flavodoxin WrbA